MVSSPGQGRPGRLPCPVTPPWNSGRAQTPDSCGVPGAGLGNGGVGPIRLRKEGTETTPAASAHTATQSAAAAGNRTGVTQ